MTREGPGRELDIDASIHEKCRYGVLPRAVMKSPRRNTAGLIILADVSPSMAPWRPFLQAVADSLALGKLRAAEMLYFSNVPRNWVYDSAALDRRVAVNEAIRRHVGLPLLVIGDGGAARG